MIFLNKFLHRSLMELKRAAAKRFTCLFSLCNYECSTTRVSLWFTNRRHSSRHGTSRSQPTLTMTLSMFALTLHVSPITAQYKNCDLSTRRGYQSRALLAINFNWVKFAISIRHKSFHISMSLNSQQRSAPFARRFMIFASHLQSSELAFRDIKIKSSMAPRIQSSKTNFCITKRRRYRLLREQSFTRCWQCRALGYFTLRDMMEAVSNKH